MDKPQTFAIEIPVGDEKAMQEFNDLMDKIQNETVKYFQNIAKTLNVSETCASDIYYLRTRSRYTYELEQFLIQLDKSGYPYINIFAFPCNCEKMICGNNCPSED